MSDEQKVWVGLTSNVGTYNIYPIGVSYKNAFDYSEYIHIENHPDTDNTDSIMFEKWRTMNSKIIDIQDKYHSFNFINIIPECLWLSKDEDEPKANDYIFRVKGGVIVINSALADILNKFNLDQNKLSPVNIRKIESNEILKEVYYVLSINELHNYMTEEQNDEYFEASPFIKADKPIYEFSLATLKNDMVEVNMDVFNCDIDLWHDPSLEESVFMSDRLKKALNDAGMADLWNMHSCTLI